MPRPRLEQQTNGAVPDPVDVPEHRALVVEALQDYAAELSDVDPDEAAQDPELADLVDERAKLAAQAADVAASGEAEPFIRGTWGDEDNFACRWEPCLRATGSERLAWLHGISCQFRPQVKARPKPRKSAGGIS